MYAVVKTGGKQYRVSKDDVIVVEKLAAEKGASVELDQVLMLDDGEDAQIGTPLVDGARVAATVLDQARGDKVIIFKKKRRKDYKRTKGHRQYVTVLRITEILTKGQKASPVKAEAQAPAAPAAEAPAETAAPARKAPAKKAPAKKAPARKAPAKKAAKKAPAKKSAAKKAGAKKAAKKAASRKTEE